MTEILNQLSWSAEPVQLPKGRPAFVATPTPAFWTLWRSSKDDVKAAGYFVDKVDGQFIVLHRHNLAAATVTATSLPSAADIVVPAATEVVYVRQAERIEGFVAQPAPEDRNWTAEQHAIFEWFRTYNPAELALEVVARAGTGKTTVIKIAMTMAAEARILYAVFGKRNQLEAQDVICDPRVDVLTLHALGFRFIKNVWSNVTVDKDVEVARVLAAGAELAPDEVVSAIVKLVSLAKNRFLWPSVEELTELADQPQVFQPEFEAAGWNIARLAECALGAMKQSLVRDSLNRISFDDMVWLPVAANWVRQEYDMVCVDECQDMNMPQLTMARLACRKDGRIVIVGDDRQAIFGFRGAVQDGMGMMQKQLNAAVKTLTVTFRCGQEIVEAAQKFVPDYKAAPSAPHAILRDIDISLVAAQAMPGDAILSRYNAPLMPLCLALLRKGVSARIEGRQIGKELAALARKMKARSVPQFITKVSSWADSQTRRFQKSKNAEAKLEQIQDTAATLVAVAEGASSVNEVLSRLENLFVDSKTGEKAHAVVLSSTHKAKGLEWNRVFLVADSYKKHIQGGEEENLYYVAMTRAKTELVHAWGQINEQIKNN
jgi:superfamily I DNA/RNA helicase